MNAAGPQTGKSNLDCNRWRRRASNADALQEGTSLRLRAFYRAEINPRSFRGARPEGDVMEMGSIGIG